MFETFDGEDLEGWGGGVDREVSEGDVISTLGSAFSTLMETFLGFRYWRDATMPTPIDSMVLNR